MKAENERLSKRLEDVDKGYINEYGARVETQEAAAKRILKEAYDAGDTDHIAEANAALAQLAIEKERLRIQKVRSEQSTEEQPQQVQQQVQQRPQELDPKLKDWMSKNPWFDRDAALTGAAKAIHYQIVTEEGFDPSTDDYWKEIDKRMAPYIDKTQGNRQVAPAVAPASSNGRSATKKSGKTTVKLDKGQIEFCRKMGIPPEKYAQEVLRLEKQRSAR